MSDAMDSPMCNPMSDARDNSHERLYEQSDQRLGSAEGDTIESDTPVRP